MMPKTQTTLSKVKARLLDGLAPLNLPAEQRQAEVAYLLEGLLSDTSAQGPDENPDWQKAVLLDPDFPVDPAVLEQADRLLERRVHGRVPVQYLVGFAHFYGFRFRVSPDVLIPRPETELLVDEAVTFIQGRVDRDPGQRLSILELGTGSGCVIVSIANELRSRGISTKLTATDICPKALAMAQQNAQDHDLSEAIDFRLGDCFEPVEGETFDLILWNPPYIDEAVYQTLEPEVRDHEPKLALTPKNAGYKYYRYLAKKTKEHLKNNGCLYLEFGIGMATQIRVLFAESDFKNFRVIKDFNDIERILKIHLE